MKSETIIAALILAASVLLCKAAYAADQPDAIQLNERFQKTVAPFLNRYCLDCHGADDPAAKLDLSGYSSANAVAEAHQTWAIILDRIEAGEMPPQDAEHQPSLEQREAVIEWIRSAREFEAVRNAGDPGAVLARRLSNAEYNYAIRDLTGVDIRPTKTFPVDPANEAGFDNTGESLTMSPALLNKYIGAARLVVEHLVLKPDGIAFAPHPVVTDTDRDKYCVKRIIKFYQQQPTDLADYFFAAWQMRLAQKGRSEESLLADTADANGVSGKYLTLVWSLLNGSKDDAGPILTLRTMWKELPDDVQQKTAAREGCRRMSDFVARVRKKLVPAFDNLFIEGNHKGSQPFVLWKNRQYASHRRLMNRSALQVVSDSTDSELEKGKSTTDTAAIDVDLAVPESEKPRYAAAFERFCSVFPDAFYISERSRDYVKESQKQDGEKGRLLSAGFHSMMGYFRDDGPLYDLILDRSGQRELDRLWQELDYVASAPMRQYVGFLWFERTDSRFMREPQFDFARPENKNSATEKMIRRLAGVYLEKARANGGTEVPIQAITHFFEEINEQIRWVEDTRVQSEPEHLKAVVEFATRAYRRQLSLEERDELLSYYQSLREDHSLTHEEAIQDSIVSVLMSPHFCYRVDLIGAGEDRRPLSDDELASRLSFFLWSSTPDDELMQEAHAGELQEPAKLIAHTRRLMNDERVRGLATEFAGNWLDFRRFEEHNAVDRERFPAFTDELRQSMFEEPIRFFVDLVQNNGSVLGLLAADHTFVDSALAKHYGMRNLDVRDNQWVRVNDATIYGRGGLLPMSVFLTKNSPGLRTSPVKRGYWTVRRILGERIPPPPPNVPELPEDESKLGEVTLREALARHREHSSCAGCHERIDSIGLAFEGFGPVGERRKLDLGGRPVDTTATFPGGTNGDGIDDLRKYLLEHRQEEFLDNLCRKLLSYALGRSLILPDELLVREMKEKLQADQFRVRSLIETIVTSPQFLNKRDRRIAGE